MNATVIRDENAFDATISALIIYDKCDFAAKAKEMLERVAHRMAESTHWSVKPWRADMLKLPLAAEAALTEAAEAHLILLAVHQVQSLLPGLVDWLERWAKCRQVPEAALAVWNGGNTGTPSARAEPELSQFTGRYGLSLIFGGNPLGEDKSAMFVRDLHEREVSLTPTLHHILERPVRESYQHWGINE